MFYSCFSFKDSALSVMPLFCEIGKTAKFDIGTQKMWCMQKQSTPNNAHFSFRRHVRLSLMKPHVVQILIQNTLLLQRLKPPSKADACH